MVDAELREFFLVEFGQSWSKLVKKRTQEHYNRREGRQGETHFTEILLFCGFIAFFVWRAGG